MQFHRWTCTVFIPHVLGGICFSSMAPEVNTDEDLRNEHEERLRLEQHVWRLQQRIERSSTLNEHRTRRNRERIAQLYLAALVAEAEAAETIS